MKAYVLGETGPKIQEVDRPSPGPGEILVRVRASGLNRVDILMSRGRKHGSAGGPGAVLGLEWAGQVVEVGEGVTDFGPGDRVMGSGGGAWAQYVVADAGRVSPIPAGMSFEEASTLPVALQTMHDAVVTHGRLQPGGSILIQGASTGVGLMGLQIAKAMGAGLVIGSSTNPERRARLAEFGADLAIDSRDPAWVEQVLAATGGQGVDAVVDQISGYVANDNMRATRIGGRVVNVGRLGGEKGEFEFDLHALRRIEYVGVTFRTRSKAEVAEIVSRWRADLWPAVESGRLRLPIDAVFGFDQLADALEHMRRNRHFGKIVLSLPDEA
jgi:NADPH2:quinone reductase